jgi:hypothetical protein
MQNEGLKKSSLSIKRKKAMQKKAQEDDDE